MRVSRILIGLGIVAVVLAVGYLGFSYGGARFSEAATIAEGTTSFRELEQRFEALADEKGGEYAFEILRRAPLPPGTDLHLLGHVVGDKLYEQKGLDGIAICTQEFRNACSHTIVIGALTEYGGEDALPLIRDACLKAPGGSGAYTMCYHGLGHGVFAYFGFDLEKTADFCGKTGTAEYGHREHVECFGGAVMELVSGGGHDPEAFQAAREKYLTETDPLSPCSTETVPEDLRTICYTYLTPYLFIAAGGNLAAPNERDFAKSFEFCDAIPKDEPALRGACFNGIGKEFPVLAMGRDIRNMERATEEQLGTMKRWCALAPHDEARTSCEHAILESLFWGGENDPDLAARFCALLGGSAGEACYGDLTGMAEFYVPKGSPVRARVCDAMPDSMQMQCKDILL